MEAPLWVLQQQLLQGCGLSLSPWFPNILSPWTLSVGHLFPLQQSPCAVLITATAPVAFLPPASGPRATLTESLLCSGLWIPVKRALGLCLHGSLSPCQLDFLGRSCTSVPKLQCTQTMICEWSCLRLPYLGPGERMQHPFLPPHHLRGGEQLETPPYKGIYSHFSCLLHYLDPFISS